jgi:A/G-specific adenine glycosylase
LFYFPGFLFNLPPYRNSLPISLMTLKNLTAIRRKLLRWYDRHHRDLPWRRTRDPYAIWIAETMLQQTQVATVLPYYERFLRELPDAYALDRAPLRRVLALWSGLGYYRRAENLKKSAREIVRKYAGRLPDNYRALLALPGVGDYTAGALMSIAFQQSYPAIDGNAYRVLDRLFAARDDKALRQVAGLLVPRSRPGYFNQGLMELGARICTPKDPHCPRCPLAAHCAARITGKRFPGASTKNSPIQDIEWPLAILRQRGKVLLRQRLAGGLLSRLWEFPGAERISRKSLRHSVASQLPGLSQGLLQRRRRIGEFRHSITNWRIRSPVYLVDLPSAMRFQLPNRRWRWLAPASLRKLPVSSMAFKAAKILADHEANLS